MKNIKGLIGAVCLSVIFCVGVIGQSLAQEKFPSKPVKIIVCFESGGGMDLNARAIQPHVEKSLDKPVVIINKVGGGGTIGFNEGAKAAPDGYTITQVSGSIISTFYTVSPDIHYRNYDPIIYTGISPGAVTVRTEAPWKTLTEFLGYARANPGKVRMSNSGHGGSSHLRNVGIELMAGVKFTHVPYKGSAPALMALVGGHVEGTCAGISDGMHLVKGGKLRILGITAPERMTAIPDIPTFKELGMDFESGSWYAYLAPKGTPKDRIKILHDVIKKAIETPKYIEYTKSQGIMNIYLGPEDLLKYLEEEDRIWSRLIEAAGVKVAK